MYEASAKSLVFTIVSMIIWLFFIIACAQIAVGQHQETPQQQRIINTAPIVIPCLNCLKNSGENLASLLRPPGCGCGCEGASYQGVDQQSYQPSVQLEPENEAGCCPCDADNVPSQSEGGPSFSVAMLAPLASVLTSIMSKIGNNQDKSVTIDFDGKTFNDNPIDEASGGPQCEISPSNQSITAPLLPARPTTPPVVYNTPPPQGSSIAQKNVGGCQCYRKYGKCFSDIEEDSLYAFAENPGRSCSCSSYLNQETSPNQANSCTYPPAGSLNHQQVQSLGNDIHKLCMGKNVIQTPEPTGNPEFDAISNRLSALFSSQNNNLNIQTNYPEQNLMPCQCCC